MSVPVVVTGPLKSGKSLVARTLRASGEFNYIREPRMIWEHGERPGGDDRVGWDDEIGDRVSRIKDRVAPMTSEEGRYLDDSPYHAISLPQTIAVFPDVRIVYLDRSYEDAIPESMKSWVSAPGIRDNYRKYLKNLLSAPSPRIISRFLKNMFRLAVGGRRSTCGPVVPGMREFMPGRELHEIVAYQWAGISAIAREDLEKIDRSRWHVVDFHALVRDTGATLEALVEFLDVKNRDAVIEHGLETIDPRRSAGPRLALSELEWRDVASVVAGR